MAGDRDWTKELAKIDKQLESVSDEAMFPTKQAPGAAPAGKAAKAANQEAQRTTSTLPALLRLGLSTALGVAIMFWPYDARCGVGAAAYLAAVAVVGVGGIWSSVWTWRHRVGRAHTLAMLLVLWSLVLGAMDVLPRIGYAKPQIGHPIGWACR